MAQEHVRKEPYSVRRRNTIILHMNRDDSAATKCGRSQTPKSTVYVVRCAQG